MKTPSPDDLVASVTGMLSLDPPPTEAEIDETLDRMAGAFGALDDVRFEARRILHANFKLRMELGITLKAVDEHAPWLAGRKAGIDPFYWSRYRQLLVRKSWGPLVVASLDRTTDELLDLLGDPEEPAAWQRRGLVVGDVQSGKTASYGALICKAADAGYKMIILLTGTLENVRRQTQERMDEAFVGLDSRELLMGPKARRKVHVGVGEIDSRRDGIVFTSQDHDFRKNAASALSISLTSVKEPVLVVSKKHKGVLNRLADWLRKKKADGGGHIDVPMLMIDDEADNASVNTKREVNATTEINRAIRDLLSIFNRASYVGFTATPFANIFIDPKSTDEMLGDDLFPRDFIHVLDAPTNYSGMDLLFPPREPDEEDAEDAFLRDIDDNEAWLPLGHKIDAEPGDLPESLLQALRSFLLATTIRDLRMLNGEPGRGGVEHRTMLVNASRFTAVQNAIADQLQIELDQIRDAVRMHGKLAPAQAEAQSPRIAALGSVFREEFAGAGAAWTDVLDALHDAIAHIRVRPVNMSTRKDKLDYGAVKGAPGVRVIVVGGNSLSRGLTLEGLSTSYFLRNSRAYDTLLQMGRWFGYRSGYDDLCRLWLTDEAQGWYRHIAEATAELKADFASMKRRKATPKEFGLRVRAHPDTLLITARNKMRTGKEIVEEWDVSLIGRMVETTRLFSDKNRNQSNFDALTNFMRIIGGGAGAVPSPNGGALIWQNVPAGLIADFLYDQFAVHPLNFDFQGDSIATFLRDAVAANDPSLSTWTVALPTEGEAKAPDGSPALLPLPDEMKAVAMIRNLKVTDGSLLVSGKSSRVGGRSDLRHGFTADEWRAINAEGKPPEADLRRRMSSPLLVLYMMQGREKEEPTPYRDGLVLPALGLHFPGEEQEGERSFVRYRLNRIAQEQLLRLRDDEEEEEEDAGDEADDDNDN